MTKKDAAIDLLALAHSMHQSRAGDEDVDLWISWLLGTARQLDPGISNHPYYFKVLIGGESRQTKLRRLIEHPSTGEHEREAARVALERLRAK